MVVVNKVMAVATTGPRAVHVCYPALHGFPRALTGVAEVSCRSQVAKSTTKRNLLPKQRNLLAPVLQYHPSTMIISSASLLLAASTALAFNPPMNFLNSSILRDVEHSTSAEGAASCIAGNISVSVQFEAHRWTVDIPTTLEGVTQFNIMSSSYDPDQIIELSTGIESIDKTYNIWVRYCAPNKPRHTNKPKSIQILTAGGCLDHRYWDFAPGYSYVDAAAAEGMATLSYDRLGTGLSDHPDPLLEAQGSAGAEVLHELVVLLRSGAFDHKFDKIIGVGHSFGSGIIDKAVSSHPSDLDAILHTGFAWRFGPRIGANTVLHLGPPRLTSHLQHLPDGYFAPTTEVGLHYSLFKYPEFDPNGESEHPAPHFPRIPERSLS